jgi:hypothetical protein
LGCDYTKCSNAVIVSAQFSCSSNLATAEDCYKYLVDNNKIVAVAFNDDAQHCCAVQAGSDYSCGHAGQWTTYKARIPELAYVHTRIAAVC